MLIILILVYNVQEINIKNRACYFFDNIININDLDPNNTRRKMDLYLSINTKNKYIGKINGDKYFTLLLTNENK